MNSGDVGQHVDPEGAAGEELRMSRGSSSRTILGRAAFSLTIIA